jgi:hypothetical protein
MHGFEADKIGQQVFEFFHEVPRSRVDNSGIAGFNRREFTGVVNLKHPGEYNRINRCMSNKECLNGMRARGLPAAIIFLNRAAPTGSNDRNRKSKS